MRGSGPGAWELAFPFSVIQLSSGLVQGGSMTNLTAALNWFPSRHTKLSVNYIRSDVRPGGIVHVAQTRLRLNLP